MSKTQLRAMLLSKRRCLDKSVKRSMDLEIQSRLLLTDEYFLCDTVLTYVSNENEIDTLGLINAAFANKKRVAVPVTNDDYSLTFYFINSVEELKKGKFNILEPVDKSHPVTDFSNSICVVPSLCCDLLGNRVGYGKGCYDRFLSTYDGKKICLSYTEDILPSIDVDETDVPVNIIVSNSFVKYI